MSNKMTQIVVLKKIVTKFHRLFNASKAVGYSLSPRTKKGYFTFECDDNEVGGLPKDVPKGHFAVYVGNGRSRFVVPTRYLSHPLFKSLLKKAEEEYGFDHHLGITLPCDEDAFEYVTSVMERENQSVGNSKMNKIMGFFHNSKLATSNSMGVY